MKLAIVMITVDRAMLGRQNYFQRTMESFKRARLWESKTPFEFHIFDSGSKDTSFIAPWPKEPNVKLHTSWWRVPPKINAGRALLVGSELGADWVIFVEDDIVVCADFLDGVAAFIEKHANEKYRAVTFYTPYREVEHAKKRNEPFWEYPVKAFYGTQCLAFRTKDAESLGRYLLLDLKFEQNTPSYDLIMKEWMYHHHPDNPYFQATVPCYAQHVGEESFLLPGRFHSCGGFAGEGWSALQ